MRLVSGRRHDDRAIDDACGRVERAYLRRFRGTSLKDADLFVVTNHALWR
jgi:hypothetical protein